MIGKVLLVLTLNGIGAFLQLAKSFTIEKGQSDFVAKYVRHAQALKYGESCSWEAEEYRQNFIRNKLLPMTSATTDDQAASQELINTLSERDYKLCSHEELFVCDKESQKCVCGDAVYESLLEVQRDLFTLENKTKCRWNATAYCIPVETISKGPLGFTMDWKCRTGTTCKLANGDPCVTPNEDHSQSLGSRAIKYMLGSDCTCTEDPVEDHNMEGEKSPSILELADSE